MSTDAFQTEKKTRILILGGGFGGFYAALHLDKTIASDSDIEVTLVSRENFVLFTPMLHEVAAGDLELSDIVNPLRQILRHVRCLEADVEAIDLAQRRVIVAYGVNRRQCELPYDHLTLHGIERVHRRLAYIRQHTLVLEQRASDPAPAQESSR